MCFKGLQFRLNLKRGIGILQRGEISEGENMKRSEVGEKPGLY